jgi:hypothetical protein
VKELSWTMADVQEMVQDTSWISSNYSTWKLHLWLATSQLLAELGHLPVSLLSKQSIPRRSGQFDLEKSAQLVLALGSTTHIVLLHLVILVKRLLFLWEARCLPRLFRCLLLKCLSHPKWSHLCYCFPYSNTTSQWDLIGIYRTLLPAAAKCFLFKWLQNIVHGRPFHGPREKSVHVKRFINVKVI